LSSIHDHQFGTLIHRGTTSEVWHATRLGPNGFSVPVALKTLNEVCATGQDQVRSFLKEARAASAVQHPNVVRVRELIFDSNRYWMSMELVRGWSLRALLHAIEVTREPMPVALALALVRDAARGLHAIHEAGLVHRGVAPDNLMISAEGQLVVLDFGLATWRQTQRIRFTPPVEVLDPMYASPDLRARLPVDARTDVYSLGALLNQLIPARANAPVALDAIIRRALDPDADRRFPTAQALEVAIDLVSIREGWLVPPSFVSAFLNDVFRTAPGRPAEPPVREPAVRPAGSGPLPFPSRAVLPRGRRTVGVGAMLPSSLDADDPAWHELLHDDD